jgi:hypothetical protein
MRRFRTSSPFGTELTDTMPVRSAPVQTARSGPLCDFRGPCTDELRRTPYTRSSEDAYPQDTLAPQARQVRGDRLPAAGHHLGQALLRETLPLWAHLQPGPNVELQQQARQPGAHPPVQQPRDRALLPLCPPPVGREQGEGAGGVARAPPCRPWRRGTPRGRPRRCRGGSRPPPASARRRRPRPHQSDGGLPQPPPSEALVDADRPERTKWRPPSGSPWP